MKKFAGMPLREYGALLFRKSMVSWRPKKLAEELDLSESYVHKIMEGERTPNLMQWLETIAITRDLEGVKQLVRDLGGVVAWRRGSLAETLRDLADEMEAEEKRGRHQEAVSSREEEVVDFRTRRQGAQGEG